MPHAALSRRWAITLGLLAVIGPIGAVEVRAQTPNPPVALVDRVIPYRDVEADDPDFRKACDWETAMPAYLVKQSEGRVLAAGDGSSRLKLKLVTQTFHIVGGGPWTGPKWLVIDGTLTDGNDVVGSFEARRQSYRGSLRACTTARELAESIADDIVEWLEAPTVGAKLGDAK